tara:strand:+ start:286 stop:468 length:183 start_codon:yes stop_codon:yes gene_type:complete
MNINLENLTNEQFEHILNLLIVYKQTHKNKNVYLNEKSIKEAIYFMNTMGKEMASQIGIN